MKTLKLLSALLMAVMMSTVAVSCGDDEEEENKKEQTKAPKQLKGQWEMSTDDFNTLKNMMLNILEQEADEDDDDLESAVMEEIMTEITGMRFEFTDNNVNLIMGIDPEWLSDVMNMPTDAEYIASAYVEDKGDYLVYKELSSTSGEIHMKFVASEDEKGNIKSYGDLLVLSYSNLSNNSVDIIMYADEDEPSFKATLTKAAKDVDYTFIWDLDWSNYYDGDDDDWEDEDW